MRRWWWLAVCVVAMACGNNEPAPNASGGAAGVGASSAGSGAGGSGGNVGGFGAGFDAGQGGLPNGGGFGGTCQLEYIGDHCTNDAGCCVPGTCWTPSTQLPGGGSVAHGMCTLDCDKYADICGTNHCLTLSDGKSYCFEKCTPGPTGSDALDPIKCHGRPDMACQPLAQGGGVCMPRCNSDADCGASLFCDVKTGLCSPTAAGGAPVGAECTPPDGGADACLGYCDGTTCTEGCTLGVAASCGWGGPGTGVAPAACLLDDPSTGLGDLGRCTALCDCDADCQASGTSCHGFGDATLSDLYGKQGYCGAVTLDGGTTDAACQ